MSAWKVASCFVIKFLKGYAPYFYHSAILCIFTDGHWWCCCSWSRNKNNQKQSTLGHVLTANKTMALPKIEPYCLVLSKRERAYPCEPTYTSFSFRLHPLSPCLSVCKSCFFSNSLSRETAHSQYRLDRVHTMRNKDGIGYKTDMNSNIICGASSWICHLAHGVLVISQTRMTFTASGLVSNLFVAARVYCTR